MGLLVARPEPENQAALAAGRQADDVAKKAEKRKAEMPHGMRQQADLACAGPTPRPWQIWDPGNLGTWNPKIPKNYQ